jgi:hypothetical protein
MRAYRPLLSCNNTPIVAIASLVVSADVSVAWQWIFPGLGNSALQTTCHNIEDVGELKLLRIFLSFLRFCNESDGRSNSTAY